MILGKTFITYKTLAFGKKKKLSKDWQIYIQKYGTWRVNECEPGFQQKSLIFLLVKLMSITSKLTVFPSFQPATENSRLLRVPASHCSDTPKTLETHLTAQTKQPLACCTALEIHFLSQSWQDLTWIFNQTLEENWSSQNSPNRFPAVSL